MRTVRGGVGTLDTDGIVAFANDNDYNFQIHQKGAEGGMCMSTDLTGNTLQTTDSESWGGRRSSLSTTIDTIQEDQELLKARDLIEEFLDLDGESGTGNADGRRLSISGYQSGKPVYYEYEYFGLYGREQNIGQIEEDDEIMVTDDETPYNWSQNLLSTKGKSRKDSIFSDYGNEMVMPLNTSSQISMQMEDYTPLEGSESTQWQKMKERFRCSFFGGSSKAESNGGPMACGGEIMQDDPQPLFKKKYFWSRKPTVPIIQDVVEEVQTPREKVSVNPNDLIKSDDKGNSLDVNAKIKPLTATGTQPLRVDISPPTQPNSAGLQLLPEEVAELIPAGLWPYLDSSYSETSITRKRLGVPKTRGRKPSPALDATKPFGCDFCERRFKRQEHLKRHVRSLHMGEKPYVCKLCNKKFSRSDNLNQHMKTHSVSTASDR